MSIVQMIFPEKASNEFSGGRVPVWGFCLMLLPVTFRALVHFLKGDSGVNSIASIHVFEGVPDPNQVIYMFSSVGGAYQTIILLIYLVVLFRYRNLIPLMFVLMLVEIVFRMTVANLHPITAEFYVRTPPGKYTNLPFGLLAATMLYVSYRNAVRGEREADAAPA
ncbi:MAG: hypothetical protein VX252_04850 [Myxococcota bacterium]|nr:hypothetical protein [Myxococcota bacterium]